jgi:hypothetical protein
MTERLARDGNPEDKVAKVSTPYLEDPFAERP